jgi:phosphatidylethanolamine-binding protein (PEBP) family uncharacterized protein
MAQESAADSLIAPRPKTASAGVILALAVAVALAVSGCGGGSDSETASAPRSTTGAQGQDPSSAKHPSSSSTDSSSSSGQDQAAGSKPSSQDPSESLGQGSAKHGQHITLPKGEPEQAATPAEQAQATVADIALASPALGGQEAPLPATYTCDGKDTWPALRWQGIPPDTAELALFAMNVQPVQGKLFFDWAVAGIDPSLTGLEAGELPKGAVMGRNSFGQSGYSVCPPKGSAETYIFTLYALPRRLSAVKGFDPHALRDQILGLSGNAGLMAASYSRG